MDLKRAIRVGGGKISFALVRGEGREEGTVFELSLGGETGRVREREGRKEGNVELNMLTSLSLLPSPLLPAPSLAPIPQDALSHAPYSTLTSPSTTSKSKLLNLHNPDSSLTLSLSGRLSFTWSFTWEEELYEWRQAKMSKEWTLLMMRGTDPSVDVAR